MTTVRVSWPVVGEAAGATYTPVSEDACHFIVRSNVTGQEYRIPHRNVYVTNFIGEPQEHKALISQFVSEG